MTWLPNGRHSWRNLRLCSAHRQKIFAVEALGHIRSGSTAARGALSGAQTGGRSAPVADELEAPIADLLAVGIRKGDTYRSTNR